MRPALLTELEQRARDCGFDLFGVVDARRFDSTQPHESRCSSELPGCGTVVVLGCGGASQAAPDSCRQLERFLAERGVRARMAKPLRSALRFSCLAEAAGLGTVSPVIHRLLHPKYGPRVSVCGVLLVEGQPFGEIPDASIADRFQPCCKCARPCVEACPAQVHDGHGGSDLERCHDEGLKGACTEGCGVVRECPIGRGHEVPPAVERQRQEFEVVRLAARQGKGLWHILRRALGI